MKDPMPTEAQKALYKDIRAAVRLWMGVPMGEADLDRALREAIIKHGSPPRARVTSLKILRADLERATIEAAMGEARGCVKTAALMVDIGRATLYRRLKHFGMSDLIKRPGRGGRSRV